MSPTAIFVIGVFTTALCILFVYVSFHEINATRRHRRARPSARRREHVTA